MDLKGKLVTTHICPRPNCSVRGVKDSLYFEFFSQPKAAILACDNLGIIPCQLLYRPREMFTGKNKQSADLKFAIRERQRQDNFRRLIQERSWLHASATLEKEWQMRELTFLVAGKDVLEYVDVPPGEEEDGDDDENNNGSAARHHVASPTTPPDSPPKRHGEVTDVSESHHANEQHHPRLPHVQRRLQFNRNHAEVIDKLLHAEQESLQHSLEELRLYSEGLRSTKPAQQHASPSSSSFPTPLQGSREDVDETYENGGGSPVSSPRSNLSASSPKAEMTPSSAGDRRREHHRRENRITARRCVEAIMDVRTIPDSHLRIDESVEAARRRRFRAQQEVINAKYDRVNYNNVQRGLAAFIENVIRQSKAGERRTIMAKIEAATREVRQQEDADRGDFADRSRFQRVLKDRMLNLVEQCIHEGRVDAQKSVLALQEKKKREELELSERRVSDRSELVEKRKLSVAVKRHVETKSKTQKAQERVQEVRKEWQRLTDAEHARTQQRVQHAVSKTEKTRSQIAILAEIRELRSDLAKERRENEERAKQMKVARDQAKSQMMSMRAQQRVSDSRGRARGEGRAIHDQQRLMRDVVGDFLRNAQTKNSYEVPEAFRSMTAHSGGGGSSTNNSPAVGSSPTMTTYPRSSITQRNTSIVSTPRTNNGNSNGNSINKAVVSVTPPHPPPTTRFSLVSDVSGGTPRRLLPATAHATAEINDTSVALYDPSAVSATIGPAYSPRPPTSTTGGAPSRSSLTSRSSVDASAKVATPHAPLFRSGRVSESYSHHTALGNSTATEIYDV
eukprot:PhM_4_TR18846/c0_g1_i1/m.100361